MTPVEPDPVRTGEGRAIEHRGAAMGNRARSGAAARPRARRHRPALGEPGGQPARDRRRRAARAGAVAEAGAARDRRRLDRRLRDARRRCGRRHRRARAGDGADARAARAAGLLPRDGAERRPVPRLVRLRADHHRERLRRPLRPGVPLPRAVALDAAVRRSRDRARLPRADRLRPPLRPQVRDLVRPRLARLPDLVGHRQVRPDRVLARPGQGRLPHVLAGRRSDAGERDLVDAARRRLHPLHEDAARRRSGAPRSATSCR